VDSTADVGAILTPTLGTYSGLTVPTGYVVLVSSGGVTYDGVVYPRGSKFTTAGAVTTATDPDPLSQIQEITERPNKKNLEFRSALGGDITANIADFADNDWVWPISGTLVKNGVSQSTTSAHKYDSAATYTGTYNVQFIFNDSAAWIPQEISPSKPIAVDASGDGSGESDFDYTTEAAIIAEYVQVKVTMQPNNQKSY
jgi:hypothetical protein